MTVWIKLGGSGPQRTLPAIARRSRLWIKLGPRAASERSQFIPR
jgi:hypothetical protein